MLEVTGAAASTAFIAGCGGGGGGGGNGGGNSSGGGGGGSGATEIEPGTEIELRSLATSWEGMSPSGIQGTENPALSLVQGETYTITWAENESGTHNLAVYDDSQSAVAGPTDQTDDPGEGLSVEFEASESTVEYVCEPHYNAGMHGSIELRQGSGGGGGNQTSGNETGGNQTSGNETGGNETGGNESS